MLTRIFNEINRIKREGLSKKELGYLLVLPVLGILGFISFYPFITTIYYSFHSIRLNLPHLGTPYVGLKNYIMLLKSSRFIYDFEITLFFASAVVAIELFFGLAIALVLNKRFKGRGIIRATVITPWAIALVVAAQFWKWMYNATFGVVNAGFFSLGLIDRYIDWLGESSLLAICSAMVAEIWRETPFMAIVMLAGLQSIPDQLYEAAKIDGANIFQLFRKITLPLLKPAILVALLFRSIVAFRAFDLMYNLTQGGPGNSTELASLYCYKLYFKYLDFGRGAAGTVLMAIFTTTLCLIYLKLIGVER